MKDIFIVLPDKHNNRLNIRHIVNYYKIGNSLIRIYIQNGKFLIDFDTEEQANKYINFLDTFFEIKEYK